MQHDGIGPYDRTVPDSDAAEDRCSCADDDTGTQLRVVVFHVRAIGVPLAQGDAVKESAVRTNHHPATNDDPLGVSHYQPRPDSAADQELRARHAQID
jgi:hypothetical protein